MATKVITEQYDIEEVSYVASTSRQESELDPFSRNMNEVKISGTTPAFKRKVSNELKKYNRSADGEVSSKQLNEHNNVRAYDVFGVVQPPHKLESFVELYSLSSPHYAAVNAKVANIVGLGYSLVETPKTKRNIDAISSKEKMDKWRKRLDVSRDELLERIEGLNEEDPFTETMIKVWRDYEVTGNGYFEIGRKRDGSIGYVGHIPAHTIRVREDRDGFVQLSADRAQFFANFGAGAPEEDGRIPVVQNPVGGDRPNELLHIKKYSPHSAYYGVPDIIAAQSAVAADEYIARFNLDYFANKATPRHVIILKGGSISATAKRDLLQFFETGLKGQNHRSIFVPLPGDKKDGEKVEFKIEPVENGIQDASFSKYKEMNLNEILMVHRVPITKISVSSGASLAVAKDADKTFKEQVCGPEQKILEKKINRLIRELSDLFLFKLTEMTLTDENTQSQIDERRRKTGVETANEQRVSRGMSRIEGGDELFDMNGKAKESTAATAGTQNRQRDADRSANATDSAGEARNPKGEGRTTS